MAGLRVGHVTLRQDKPVRLRTGVTAILPHSGNLATEAVFAAASVLNGNGEMTGLASIDQTGLLNSPIVLTNTMAVGAAHRGVHQYYQKHYGNAWTGQLPVVAECWDGVFNTITQLDAVTPEHVVQALENAQPGPFAQGAVGAGTGMRSFDLHAGIGSASRRVTIADKTYTVGVLVNANHSKLNALAPHIRQMLERQMGSLEAKRQRDNRDALNTPAFPLTNPQGEGLPKPGKSSSRQGSIIVIIATDAPLLPPQLKQLANRAALGIGATGSTMDTTSGDFALAFSTATRIPVGDNAGKVIPMPDVLHPDALSPLQRATVEAVTEAQIQALLHNGL